MKIAEIKEMVQAIGSGKQSPQKPIGFVVAEPKNQDMLRDYIEDVPGIRRLSALDEAVLSEYFDKNGHLTKEWTDPEVEEIALKFSKEDVKCIFDFEYIPYPQGIAAAICLARKANKPLIAVIPPPASPYKATEVPFLEPFELIECEVH